MTNLFYDLRNGLRVLTRNPSFAVPAIIMFALGVGVVTSVFSIANDFLLRPLPFGNSDRVVMVKRYFRDLPQSGTNDPPTFRFWQERNRVFADMAVWSEMPHDHYNLTGAQGPERVAAKQVSAAFFRVLGVQPVLGRTFLPPDREPGGDHVALISHALWRTRFGADPDILGKALTLDGEDYSILGVLPTGFRFSATPEDVWTSVPRSYLEGGHGGEFLNVIALLKPGVTLAQANNDIQTITSPWARQFSDWGNGDQWVAVESLRDRYARELRPEILALLGAGALVLLIACANLANLLLARAMTRYKEIAMRRTLGASRVRIIRQMLAENFVLALLGTAMGLLLAFAGTKVLYTILPIGWQPIGRVGINSMVLIFALLALVLTVVLAGLMPAWSATGFDLNESLKEGLRSPMVGMSSRSFRATLVAGEVALATLLLVGTGLLVKSFVRLSGVSLGFAQENLLTVDLARTSKGADAFYQRLLERLTAMPQVRAVGAINVKPLYGGPTWHQDINIEGRPPLPRGVYIYEAHRSVSAGYFRAMGIPLLKGRSFVPADQDGGAAVISESMARQCWPGEDPIGKRFGVNCANVPCKWQSVIGVVGDVKEDGATGGPTAAMYFDEVRPDMTVVIRSVRNPEDIARDVRSIAHSVDPDQPLGAIRTMEQIAADATAPRRLTMLVAGSFAGLALLLAMVGLYGVLSYTVAQRNHEFGIRVALGAKTSDVLRLVMAHGLSLAGAGIGMGAAGALALQELLKRFLFGVAPNDPGTFCAIAIFLMGVALLACYLPARRAAHVDPMEAIRHE